MTTPVGGQLAFVTGGSGFVGGRLLEILRRRGWGVRALARSSGAAGRVARLGAEPVRAELDNRAALARALDGVSVVFHAAAHFRMWGPRAEFDRVNVHGTRAIAEAALDARTVRRFVHVSAAAVVMGDPEPMLGADERLPLEERHWAPYSSSKAAAERVIAGFDRRRPGFGTVIVRPPFIWGAGMPVLDEVVHAAREGRFRWVGGGGQAMATCHVDNLCDALLLAAERGRGGEAYFVSDDEPATLRSMFGALFATAGVEATDRAIPFRLAWAGATIAEAAWRTLRMRGEPAITRQMLRLVGQPFTIEIAKARAHLGYTPSLSIEEGLAAMRAAGPGRC